MRVGAGVIESLSQARHRPPSLCAFALAVQSASAPRVPPKFAPYSEDVTKTRALETVQPGGTGASMKDPSTGGRPPSGDHQAQEPIGTRTDRILVGFPVRDGRRIDADVPGEVGPRPAEVLAEVANLGPAQPCGLVDHRVSDGSVKLRRSKRAKSRRRSNGSEPELSCRTVSRQPPRRPARET